VSGAPGPWHEIVSKLELGGVARMIAEHSELLECSGDTYRLRLDEAHDTLLSDAQTAAVARALSACQGGDIRVQIEVGRPLTETPAQRFERQRAERQRAAEQTLAADDTVRTLIRDFGARIDGVRPLEDASG
jgi:DNA polymerase-3 subunit gamma/tau